MKAKLIIGLVLMPLLALAQPGPGSRGARGERKFDIIVTNVQDSIVRNTNRGLQIAQDRSIQRSRNFATDLLMAASNTGVNQAVGITTNLIGLGVNTLSKAIKGDREKWYNTAKKHCLFTRVLKTDTKISDFYAAGSTKGAMDPENLKFEGFGCHNYIELKDEPDRGNEAFYVFCSLRRDSLGLAYITDHSKFIVEIDTLMFAPKYCNLPNDSTGRLNMAFDFNGRKDLVFNMKARIYSSWINEAILINDRQLLGEFNITARIQPEVLEDGKFIYTKNSPKNAELVSVSGDCFIVPRSFTGTTDARSYTPSWGTGQYSIEMEITESCLIDDKYYMTQDGKRKWDKQKWQPEWEVMKAAQRQDPDLLQQAWQTVRSGYVNNGWIAIITEPVTTTLIKSETVELKKLLNLPAQQSAATQQTAKPAQTGAQQGAAQGGQGKRP